VISLQTEKGILSGCRNHFSQLLNVRGVSDVRQTEIHTAEPPVPAPSAFEIEMAIEKLKGHESPSIDQIPAEFIKSGIIKIPSEICQLIIIIIIIIINLTANGMSPGGSGYNSLLLLNTNFIWNKEELPEKWKGLIILPIYWKDDKQIVVIIETYHFCQLRTKCYPTSCCQGQLHLQRKLMGIISVDFHATGQLLIIYSAFVKYSRTNGNTIRQCISYLYTSRKPIIRLGR